MIFDIVGVDMVVVVIMDVLFCLGIVLGIFVEKWFVLSVLLFVFGSFVIFVFIV